MEKLSGSSPEGGLSRALSSGKTQYLEASLVKSIQETYKKVSDCANSLSSSPDRAAEIYASMRGHIQRLLPLLDQAKEKVEEKVKEVEVSFHKVEKNIVTTVEVVREKKEKKVKKEFHIQNLKKKEKKFSLVIEELNKEIKKQKKNVKNEKTKTVLLAFSGILIAGLEAVDEHYNSRSENSDSAATGALEGAFSANKKAKRSKKEVKKLVGELNLKLEKVKKICKQFQSEQKGIEKLAKQEDELDREKDSGYKTRNEIGKSFAKVCDFAIEISLLKSSCTLLEANIELIEFYIKENLGKDKMEKGVLEQIKKSGDSFFN